MKIVCAWCNKDMEEIDGEGVGGVSHGVCEECLKELLERIKRKGIVRKEPGVDEVDQGYGCS